MKKRQFATAFVATVLLLTPRESHARWMNPNTGRFCTVDPIVGVIRDPMSLHKYVYGRCDVVDGADPSGLSGILTLASSGNDSSSFGMQGHAFVAWKPDGGTNVTTYGTWGNDPNGSGNGLHVNLESGWTVPSDETREKHIDDAAEAKFMAIVTSYGNAGSSGWHTWNNCAGFAADAWLAGTGEDFWAWVAFDYPADILTPTLLRIELQKANKNGYRPAPPRRYNPYDFWIVNDVDPW
jgi:hypothetical protein